MNPLHFTVDAALLRELGERLVGKPYVALAELIKNAYDADATTVELKVLPECIEVYDDGHGMNFDAFRNFWMRIGSPHKDKQKTSPGGRSLTGQKGVGRLAVQFLGRELELFTKSVEDETVLKASINWDDAVKADQLTKVPVQWERVKLSQLFPGNRSHGTGLRISGLAQQWTAKDVSNLALEIWSLQPPFEMADRERKFNIRMVDAPETLSAEFGKKIEAFRSLWHAKIIGKLIPPKKPGRPGHCDISIIFDDQSIEQYTHEIEPCPLRAVDFEIAIYSLTGKQPFGISVGDLREYLREFGGVSIYDGGFRLPFYGVETDWLHVQLDHSRRIVTSLLLPQEYQVESGLNFLPTNQRILGAVHVSTGEERRWLETHSPGATRPLEIAISRDRLVDNEAYRALTDAVRVALDFYAMREAARELKDAESQRPTEIPASSAVERVTEILERHSDELPAGAAKEIKSAVANATNAVATENKVRGREINLLAALATAGMVAAALDHETARQMKRVEDVADQLAMLAGRPGSLRSELRAASDELRSCLEEARATRRLFTELAEPESREVRERLRARAVIESVVSRLGRLMRGVPVNLERLPADLRLPIGSSVEWSALFQNVLVNAVNATLESNDRRIVVTARNEGVAHTIRVEDTGAGVDLAHAEELFEPFVHRLKLSPARRGLRIGGSGLGLTIVRMIAHNLGCRISFTEPDTGYSTAFRLAWKESK